VLQFILVSRAVSVLLISAFFSPVVTGTSQKWYVEWDQGVTTTEGDDSGDAKFRFLNTELTFQLQARGSPNFHIQALMEFDGDDFTSGYKLDGGWSHNGEGFIPIDMR
jgi:hypothetical protein